MCLKRFSLQQSNCNGLSHRFRAFPVFVVVFLILKVELLLFVPTPLELLLSFVLPISSALP